VAVTKSDGDTVVAMDTEEGTTETVVTSSSTTAAPATVPPSTLAKKDREPTSFLISNPGRLTPAQAKYVSILDTNRYIPVGRRSPPTGIVILADNDPSAPQQVAKGEADLTVAGI